VAELELGVLVAADADARAAAPHSVRCVPSPPRSRSTSAPPPPTPNWPTWIAATALVNQSKVWTQDDDVTDFAGAVSVARI